jgi:hypothetical protein
MKHYLIIPNDMKTSTGIFSREQWEKYKCSGCGAVKRYEVVKNEIIGSEPLPIRLPDFFETDDRGVFIVSKKAKEVIESFPGTNVCFFPLARKNDYFALLPNHLIYPPEEIRVTPAVDFAGQPFRAVYRKCLICDSYPSVAFNSELFTVPDNVLFAGIVLGPELGYLIGSSNFITHLKKEKLKGFSYSSRLANNK